MHYPSLNPKLFWAIVLSAMIAACTCPKREYLIPEGAFEAIPYLEDSLFTLQDSAGNTALFSRTSASVDKFPVADGCSECCQNEYGQKYVVVMHNDSLAVDFTLSMTASGHKKSADPVVFEIETFPSGRFSFDLDGNPCYDASILCLDSMQIDGVFHHDVYQMENLELSTQPETVKTLWYNTEKGVLKLLRYDGTYLELKH